LFLVASLANRAEPRQCTIGQGVQAKKHRASAAGAMPGHANTGKPKTNAKIPCGSMTHYLRRVRGRRPEPIVGLTLLFLPVRPGGKSRIVER
jgi:hypothetical protein